MAVHFFKNRSGASTLSADQKLVRVIRAPWLHLDFPKIRFYALPKGNMLSRVAQQLYFYQRPRELGHGPGLKGVKKSKSSSYSRSFLSLLESFHSARRKSI
jgi:hypothetical protein